MKRCSLLPLVLALSILAGERPQRIVSLSPNITELLYGVGAFSQVVGISDFCSYPPEVKKLPIVGAWQNIDFEKLTILHPDLVMLDDAQSPSLGDRLQQLGFKRKVIVVNTISDVYQAMMVVGQATGHEEGAGRLIDTTRTGLQHISQKTSGLDKPKVLLVVDRTPGTLRELNVADETTYLGELVAIAGGRVVAPRFPYGYGKLSKEDLVVLNPDIILDFIHGTKVGNPMDAWREMPELRAVRDRRVKGVNEDYVPHPSQRIVQTAELFARLIHPEVKW
jgi:iron complex transport system substrate-binding protein